MTHIRNSEELADLPVPDHDGIPPVWIHRDNKDEAMRELIDALNSLKEAGTNFNTKNLVILGYRHKDGKQVVAALKAVGLNAQQVRRDQLSLDGEFIPVTTLYQVKGLEFKHVFIWGLRDSVIPGASLHYKDDDADEEEVIDYGRRLLYVAVTRAKEGVWMFSDSKTPTRFISELDNDLYENL
jgi:superfamily I DNA/RNA helicase